MAAQVGGDDDLITAINVTPLVDVVLVLLIIFMVTSEVIHEQDKMKVIQVELPAAASADELLSKGLLSLVINSKGQLFLNGEKSELKEIKVAIEATKKIGVTAQALITADERTAHGAVVELMDALRLGGVREIAINTKKQVLE